jgi:hypothetical protein
VRVTAPTLSWDAKEGTLTEVRGDTLLVRTAGGPPLGLLRRPTRVPANAITKLEVSLNQDAHLGAQFLLPLIGGAAGAVVGYSAGPSCGSGFDGLGCGLGRVGWGGLGLLGGSLLGLMIAEAAVPERWATLSPGSVRVGVAPLPSGRLGFGATVNF